MHLGISEVLPFPSLEIFSLWLDKALRRWSNGKSEPGLGGKLGLTALAEYLWQPKLYYNFTWDSCSTAEVPTCDLSLTTQLLGSFLLRCITFLLFWSNTSFHGFCKLRSQHRLDSLHLFIQYFRFKPWDFSLESCRGKKIKAVARNQIFLGLSRKRQWWTKSFMKEGGTLVEYLAKPNPSCWFLWTFVCIYQSLNLQFLILLL